MRRQLEEQLQAAGRGAQSFDQPQLNLQRAFDLVAGHESPSAEPAPGGSASPSTGAGAAAPPAEAAALPGLAQVPHVQLIRQLSQIRAAAPIREAGEQQRQDQATVGSAADVAALTPLASVASPPASRRASAQLEPAAPRRSSSPGAFLATASHAEREASCHAAQGQAEQSVLAPEVGVASSARHTAPCQEAGGLQPVSASVAHQVHSAALEQMLAALSSGAPAVAPVLSNDGSPPSFSMFSPQPAAPLGVTVASPAASSSGGALPGGSFEQRTLWAAKHRQHAASSVQNGAAPALVEASMEATTGKRQCACCPRKLAGASC